MSKQRTLPHGNAKYPWSEWTNGGQHSVTLASNRKAEQVRANVHQYAGRHDLEAETHVDGRVLVLTMKQRATPAGVKGRNRDEA